MYEASGGGGGYLCRDELGMNKLRGDNTRSGSPKSGHESHLISTMYICGGSASSQWGRRTVGNGDVVGDVGGQVPSVLMDGDRDVSSWANVWDGSASLCAMEPMS